MEREYLSHEERTDRRLAGLLAIIREEKMKRCGILVPPGLTRRWANVQDPLSHISNKKGRPPRKRGADENATITT